MASIVCLQFRATSHTGLRACDHRISSTLVGGEGRAGASSSHTTLEGPMEYVNAIVGGIDGASASSSHTTLEGPTEYVNARWM
jgi:hypothetical protein